MTKTLTGATALILLTGSAFAQQQPAAVPTAPNDVPEVQTEAQAQALVGAPLEQVADGDALPLPGEPETLLVLDAASIRPAAEWTPAMREQCEQSGGAVLEIYAGRLACFPI